MRKHKRPKYKPGDILTWWSQPWKAEEGEWHHMLITEISTDDNRDPTYLGVDLGNGDPEDWAGVEFIDNHKNVKVT